MILKYGDKREEKLTGVPMNIELSELIKNIEEKLSYSDVTLEQFDPDFEEWMSIQNTSDLRISDGSTFKVCKHTYIHMLSHISYL